jgi:hypothetical protein
LRGTFDPDEMTLRLGFTPTSSSAQGSRNPQRGLPKTSQWHVSTERIVAEVVSQLEGNAAQIKDAIAAFDLHAVLEVVLYFSSDEEVSTPAIGFSHRVIAFLADVNASIDIDTYILPNQNNAVPDPTASRNRSDEQSDDREPE